MQPRNRPRYRNRRLGLVLSVPSDRTASRPGSQRFRMQGWRGIHLSALSCPGCCEPGTARGPAELPGCVRSSAGAIRYTRPVISAAFWSAILCPPTAASFQSATKIEPSGATQTSAGLNQRIFSGQNVFGRRFITSTSAMDRISPNHSGSGIANE